MLFNQIIYGPIHSRRLGLSLGINLMPTNAKLCTFNCIYCECGWNTHISQPQLPTLQDVTTALENTLKTMTTPPDVITFSGNGEPTLHPDFDKIILNTCSLRNQYCPDAKVSVLSNSTQLTNPKVVKALKMADNKILKLDSAIDSTMKLIDQPINPNLTVNDIKQLFLNFGHDFTLQTCFLKGLYNGQIVDNTTDQELNAYYHFVKQVAPKNIMIYVIDRATPCYTLEKITPQRMQSIAQQLRKLGFEVSVSA